MLLLCLLRCGVSGVRILWPLMDGWDWEMVWGWFIPGKDCCRGVGREGREGRELEGKRGEGDFADIVVMIHIFYVCLME